MDRKETLYRVNVKGMEKPFVVQALSRASARKFVADIMVSKAEPLTPIEAVALTSGPLGVDVTRAA